MKTNSEILKTFNCPERAVKHNGVWMWPEELDVPKAGDAIWNPYTKEIETASGYLASPRIIFRSVTLPHKPTLEQLANITPAGKVATLKDEPDCESVPFVNDDCRFICTHEDSRAALYHGLRWPVTLTDAPKEQVKPTDPRFIGLNPSKFSMDVLATMPEGARLLESEGEREAFDSRDAGTGHDELWWYFSSRWKNHQSGCSTSTTYCTTRPRGWWQVKAEPVAVKVEPLPMLYKWDDPQEAVDYINKLNQRMELLIQKVEALEKK